MTFRILLLAALLMIHASAEQEGTPAVTPNADTFSESHLHFTNQDGTKLWSLPYTMTEHFATPTLAKP